MNAYTNIGISAALLAMGAAGGYGSAVYMRPLQPPQQQAAAAPPPAPAPAPVIRTVSWFKGHDAERTAKLEACADNPGVARTGDPECTNARVAQKDIGYDRFIKAANK
jgi:hypothetical protein